MELNSTVLTNSVRYLYLELTSIVSHVACHFQTEQGQVCQADDRSKFTSTKGTGMTGKEAAQ